MERGGEGWRGVERGGGVEGWRGGGGGGGVEGWRGGGVEGWRGGGVEGWRGGGVEGWRGGGVEGLILAKGYSRLGFKIQGLGFMGLVVKWFRLERQNSRAGLQSLNPKPLNP